MSTQGEQDEEEARLIAVALVEAIRDGDWKRHDALLETTPDDQMNRALDIALEASIAMIEARLSPPERDELARRAWANIDFMQDVERDLEQLDG